MIPGSGTQDLRNDLEWRFRYHPPMTAEKTQWHEFVRSSCLRLAKGFADLPDGREKSLALTKLEEVMFWANAAIARHKEDGPL